MDKIILSIERAFRFIVPSLLSYTPGFIILPTSIDIPSTLFSQITKVQVPNVSFLIFVKGLENLINHRDLKLDPQMVQSLLKFSKTNPVVEISIKVSIGISH